MEDRYLYKAKRISDGEWIVGYLYRLSENNPPFIMLRKYGESYEVDEHTICRCTGSKDKNGNLIWENDIAELFGHRGVIKYVCGGFGIAYKTPIDWDGIEANIKPITAVAASCIAGQCSIKNNDNYIDVSGLDGESLEQAAVKYTIFGRVTPEKKRIIVRALQKNNNKVAMTGDGVNDLLALRQADCSIAMGNGSDAAKQTAQLVLLDSDFGVLKDVISEGRRVINNMTKSAAA